ncbi:response regulator transcription factor [Bradyrhizobium sp. AUGA SZCCT0274]|uniref:response regulator transcription factor n=1 Tax=unclassified Bradyrhizobium TaxID=2631580 RepID=UPI003908B36C
MLATTALARSSALPTLPRLPMSMAADKTDRPLVLIVDDDEDVRFAIRELLLSVGIDACCFGSTQELLQADLPERPGCLILDVRMPGASGLDLQHHLGLNGHTRPIIFLTGHGDIAMTVQAMKAGAIDFLTKPVRDQTLLDAVTAGIEKDISLRTAARQIKLHVDRYAKLTPREREVMREVARGRLNKQIAFDLGISEITVKLHRGNVTKKMQATSVGQLIRIWEQLPAEIREGKSP